MSRKMNRELYEFMLLLHRSAGTSVEGWVPYSNATRPLVFMMVDKYPDLFEKQDGHVKATQECNTLMKWLI